MLLNGTFGFYVDLHGYSKLTADQSQTPCWDFVIGVELTPGIRMRIPWDDLEVGSVAKRLGWDKDLVSAEFDDLPPLFEEHPFDASPAEERACESPPESALPLGEGPTSETYQSPRFAPWAYRYGAVSATQPHVANPGQSRVYVEKGHDSSWILSGPYLGGILDLSDTGEVRWARAIDLGLLPDEDVLALANNASSVLAAPSSDAAIFAASDRLTLLSVGYDGELRWARRLRVPRQVGLGTDLPDEELRRLSPIAMASLPNGDFGVLYSRRTVEGKGGEVLLLRTSAAGEPLFARRFHFPTGNTSLGAALIPIDDDLLVAGWSMQPSAPPYRSYLLRFDRMGSPRWARRLDACDEESPSVSIESVMRRASGDIALLATDEPGPGKPDRTAFVTLSPEGQVRGALAVWSGHGWETLEAVTIAELPTSGFVSLETWRRFHGNRLELSTRDSLGARTAGVGLSFGSEVGDHYANLRPAGLRLTTDGGAIVVAHIDNDEEVGLYTAGLFVTKIPARTFNAPFDPQWIAPEESTFPTVPCSASTAPVTVEVTEVSLIDRNVDTIVQLSPLTPQRDARMK